MRFLLGRLTGTDLLSGAPGDFFARLPVLETPDLVLRPPRMRDAKAIHAYASDPEVARYVLWDPHRSLRETREYVRSLIVRARRGDPSAWVIALKGTDQAIGTIGFVWYSSENRSAELGYSLAREYWNHGYASQALLAVSREAFRSLPLNRLEAQHDLRNPASGKVMEHAGFRKEGVLRERLVNKGEFVSVALYALLRADLPSFS